MQMVPSTRPEIVSGSSAVMSPVIVIDGPIPEGECIGGSLWIILGMPIPFPQTPPGFTANRAKTGFEKPELLTSLSGCSSKIPSSPFTYVNAIARFRRKSV